MLNNSQARIIDPILSNHVRGYRQAGLVGRNLFPLAPVPMYGGQIIEFGKESFRRYNTRRAPGAKTERIEFGYAGKPYAITPSALEAKVPRELMRDASQVPGIDLGSRAVNTAMRALELDHEYQCATLARTAGNYDSAHKATLSGTSKWGGSAADPAADIRTGREAIRSTIGVYPNTAVLSATAFSSLERSAQIVERLKYVGASSLTIEMLKNLWRIPNIFIGEAVLATGATDTFGDVWGNDVVLAYCSSSQGDVNANAEEPSYGYTYLIDGMPMVEQAYWDNNAKSWIYGVSYDNTPVLSGMTAGYLLIDAGA